MILFNCLNLTFKELKINQQELFDYDTDNEKYQHLDIVKMESIKKICPIINYTECILDPEFISCNTTNINIGILGLRIMDLIMRKDINS